MEYLISLWNKCIGFFNKSVAKIPPNQRRVIVVSTIVSVAALSSIYIYKRNQSKYEEEKRKKVRLLLNNIQLSEHEKLWINYPNEIKNNLFYSHKYLEYYPVIYNIGKPPKSNNSDNSDNSDVKMCYNIFGDSNGIPILHMHGGGSCVYDGLMLSNAAIKHGFKIIVVDRPGIGNSNLPNMNYSLEEYANDLAILLKNELGINEIILSGISQGATFVIPLIKYFEKNENNINIKIISVHIICGLPIFNNQSINNNIYKCLPKGSSIFFGITTKWPLFLYKFLRKLTNPTKEQMIKMFETKGKNARVDECDSNFVLKNINQERDNNGNAITFVDIILLMGNYASMNGVIGDRWAMKILNTINFDDFFNDIGSSSNVELDWYHGVKDKIVTIEWVREYQQLLKDKTKLKVISHEYENCGHMNMFDTPNIDTVFKNIKDSLKQ